MTTLARPAAARGEGFGVSFAVIWLVFLLAPIVRLVTSQQAWPAKVTGVGLLVGFAVAYAAAFRYAGMGAAHTRLKLRVLAGLVAVAVVTWLVLGPVALSFSPYLLAYASFALPPFVGRIAAPGLVALLALLLVATDALSEHWSLLLITATIAVMGLITSTFVLRERETEAVEREQLVLSERHRLARDVHDLLGHSLTVIGLKAQLVERLMDSDPERARAELVDLRSITADALSGVRQTVGDVRLPSLTEALSHARASLAVGGVGVRISGDVSVVPGHHRAALAWVVREVATNVLRHADATRLDIGLAAGGATFTDDGVGLDGPAGHGIRGMQERMHAVGATLTVRRGSSGGTVAEVVW